MVLPSMRGRVRARPKARPKTKPPSQPKERTYAESQKLLAAQYLPSTKKREEVLSSDGDGSSASESEEEGLDEALIDALNAVSGAEEEEEKENDEQEGIAPELDFAPSTAVAFLGELRGDTAVERLLEPPKVQVASLEDGMERRDGEEEEMEDSEEDEEEGYIKPTSALRETAEETRNRQLAAEVPRGCVRCGRAEPIEKKCVVREDGRDHCGLMEG